MCVLQCVRGMCILYVKVIYTKHLARTADSRIGSFEALRANYVSSVKRVGLFTHRAHEHTLILFMCAHVASLSPFRRLTS